MARAPSVKWTAAIADEIVDRVSNGEGIRTICRAKHMPCFQLVWRRIAADAKFMERMEAARSMGADAIADECIEIADRKRGDVNRDRLRIDTRLKLLSKWHPKKYGEKMALTGADDGPIIVQVNKLS